ncbi:MAG TPA: hypothetical protein EYP56_10720 [Planctomycetaceae bacterium]|nr:hypothetical protein [Planctomycetaceae bacterium]HIQ23193.1 hypothetical protein [Planctomycetota bacterium]
MSYYQLRRSIRGYITSLLVLGPIGYASYRYTFYYEGCMDEWFAIVYVGLLGGFMIGGLVNGISVLFFLLRELPSYGLRGHSRVSLVGHFLATVVLVGQLLLILINVASRARLL